MNAISNAEVGAALFERPLGARSLIGSLLLGIHPPRLSAAALVAWCELFDIAPGTARVALARMVERGELATADGVYELAGRVLARQRAQDRALAPTLREWDGSWLVAVVTADSRTAIERGELRAEMRSLHFAEQREGVWTRPDNLAGDEPAEQRRSQCRTWRAVPLDSARELAEALFELDAWASRGRMLLEEIDSARHAVERDDAAIPRAFYAGAASLGHLRSDPLLPRELLRDGWPADRLRAAYAEYQPAFADAVRRWRRARSRT